MKHVLIVAGEICSGKDTFVKSIAQQSNRNICQIDLGELVREKFKTKDRVFDNNLEPYFIERITDLTKDIDDKDLIIVTGVRQPSLTQKIAALFDSVEYVYLVVPRKILQERYQNRGATKDKKITFIDAIRGDQSLGMRELQHYLLTEVECNFIKNY